MTGVGKERTKDRLPTVMTTMMVMTVFLVDVVVVVVVIVQSLIGKGLLVP